MTTLFLIGTFAFWKKLAECNLNPVLDPSERIFFEKLQTILKARRVAFPRKLLIICGVDAAYSDNGTVVAVASSIDVTRNTLLEHTSYIGKTIFPYTPGLLFLREGPFVMEAVHRLKSRPALICFDAQGIAHPRRKGLATICGMLLEAPTIGIAKSKLIGEIIHYRREMEKLVTDDSETLGFVTKSPRRFWSPGFSVSLRSLEHLIVSYGNSCLTAMSESHTRANSLLKSMKGI
jgi:deoxyribonuclease V